MYLELVQIFIHSFIMNAFQVINFFFYHVYDGVLIHQNSLLSIIFLNETVIFINEMGKFEILLQKICHKCDIIYRN